VTEDELREWHRVQPSLLKRLQLVTLARRFQYWPGSCELPAHVAALDWPRECLATAIEVHRLYGYGVALGWVASDAHPRPVVHAWNLEGVERVIDAADARRTAAGYLGAALEPWEIDFLAVRNPYSVRTGRGLRAQI
jgi:hypothetical protein